MKKPICFKNLFAHFDVAQLGGMGELQFFPKPVQNGGVEVRALVQQVEQFGGRGCVLIVGLEAARILDGDGQRVACENRWLAGGVERARMLTRILETILSCEFEVENTTLRATHTWKGVSH